ncbi:beta family protein [Sinorhizobium terangae]|uniref:beta family protein n=1 Tax=Sinorhizobium terangae TaxID=110322 RepID=UPI0024B2380D|nr:hypothetical protein [Sinorhizobium terangae]WFU49114.1 hypothetical protein QA637_06860 [Sinorhizobium terangae]
MFETTSYFPSLTTRAGELSAYDQCYAPVKDALIPIFTLTRNADTESLVDSAAALVAALDGRSAIVDFDPRPRKVTSLAEAAEKRRRANLRRAQSGQREGRPRSEKELANDAERLRRTEAFNESLTSLTEPSRGPFRWLELVGTFPELVPILRIVDAPTLRRQLEQTSLAGRPAAIRIRVSEGSEAAMVMQCADLIGPSAASLVLIIDAGNIWARVDSAVADVKSILLGLRAAIGEGFEDLTTVVLSTGFPRQPLRTLPAILPISDLTLHRRIAEDFDIRLGDYGSLPNRTEDTPARGWFPHVDLVTPDDWHISLFENNRDPKKYIDASRVIANKTEWAERAQCWGASVIEQVSRGVQIIDGKSFTHPAAWLTVRVNQHLSQMARRRR